MDMPSDDGLGQRRMVARSVFWVGMALTLLPGVFADSTEVVNGEEVASASTSFVAFGVLVVIVGAVLLRGSKKARTAHENAKTNIQAMKAVAASW